MPLTPVPLSEGQLRHPHAHGATSALFTGAITHQEVLDIARAISSQASLTVPPRVCVTYGYGSQPRALYRELRTRPGLHVLWQGTIAPVWLRPIAMLFAAQGGLIKVEAGEQLPSLVDSLSHLAMMEVYSFSADRLPAVTSYVQRNGWRSFIGRVIGEDSGYLCLGVTGDSSEVPTGHYAWVSYGNTCPADLRSATSPWCATQAA